MYSESVSTLSFLSRDQQCILPIFQRPYTWNRNDECKTLFENVRDIGENDKRDSWYLGAIVCQNKGPNLARPTYVLIDGQQRLTSVSLMVCVITEYLRKHPKTTLEGIKNWDSALKKYVIDSEGEEDKWYRLLLNNEDKEDLKELIYKVSVGEDIPKYKGRSKIFTNYQFFKRNINKNNIKNVWRGLNKLEMIHIRLDEKDVAQNIFETLNSTGQSLRQIDQIRNYLLMGMDPLEAEDIYHHYWRPMELRFEQHEEETGNNHFDYFTRYYLILKLNRNVPSKNAYDKFRVVSENFENAKQCIKELNEFSEYYLNIFGAYEKDPILKKEFEELEFVSLRLMSPFLMKLYKLYADKNITKNEFLRIFKVLKSYTMRKSLCGGLGNSSSDNIALRLCKVIENNGSYEDILNVLFSYKGYTRFLTDEQVKENMLLQNFKVYSKNHFVLSKLINFDRVAPIDSTDLELTYVCPTVSDEYLDKIGNLTLEGIDLCMDIEAESNEEFIDKRTEALIDLILKVWEYPSL